MNNESIEDKSTPVGQDGVGEESVCHSANSEAQHSANTLYRVLKRCFDFVASLVASVILLIPMLIIALIIAIKDPGNPIYVQKRVGLKGETLKVYKFRSMKAGADMLENSLSPEQYEEYKKEYKLLDDPRLLGYKGSGKSCLGSFMRKTSIDELPQILFNILIRGNMSIVGPRPLLKEEIEKYYTDEQQKMLHSVKPGLTGYWQAYARNDATYESGKRQEMELYYIQNRSVSLDIKIILKTFTSVIRKTGN